MAEYPIIMKQKNDQGTYDTLYPKTIGSQVEGTISSSQITGTFPSSSITGQFPASQIDDIYTKSQTLTSSTAALFGLGTSAVPDDVLAYLGKYNQYWWRRRTPAKEFYQASESVPPTNYVAVGWQTSLGVSYSNSYSVNQNTGEISLVSPTTEILETNSQTTSALNIINTKLYGKYFNTSKSSVIYKIDKQLVAGDITLDTDWYVLSGRGLTLTSSKTYIPAGDWEYLQSSSRSAYPDSGEQDGYEYQYLGIPFENAATAPAVFPKIVTGSYVGTGTYGVDNPNSLTFEFEPKFVFVSKQLSYSAGYGLWLNCYIWIPGVTGIPVNNTSNSKFDVNGNTLSWYSTNDADTQLNSNNTEYVYYAIG